MIGMDSEHFQVVAESLKGERQVDDHTFAALAVLSERLERLKKIDEAFSNIVFSSAVKKLQSQKNAVVLG